MIEKICFCGHEETKHKYLNLTVDQIIQRLIKARILIPQHSPDQMGYTGYFFPGENFNFHHHEKVAAMIGNLKDNHSYCQKTVFLKTCTCGKFQADNLKYLEVCCERSTS